MGQPEGETVPPADEALHQPHDRLLRATFSDPANARGFLEGHLPERVAGSVRWDSLRLVPCSFIDPALAATESDLVFRVLRRNRESYLYVLFEHQSTEDPFMAFRLARYVLQLWERHRVENPRARKVPAVFPLVLFQGNAPWKSGKQLRDRIDLEPGAPVERWQLNLEFCLMELFRTDYQGFRGTPEGVLALRVLKAEPLGELLSEPVWEVEKWLEISVDAVSRLMRYICTRNLDRGALSRRIQELKKPELEETLMTIAEQYRAEGRAAGHAAGHAAGREEGIREGESRGSLGARRRAVLRALEIRHGAVPPELAERVTALQSEELLDSLLETAICSASLSDFVRQFPNTR